ncbi:PHD finger protein 7, partial [Paragonimus heterotremus]
QNLDKWLELCTEAPSCCICLFSILSDLPAVTSAKIKVKSKHENSLIGSASNSTDTPKSERRLPRRSCMTMSTPKRIRVSVRCDVRRLSSFNSSSWEVSDSLPDPPEPEPDVKSDEPSPIPTYKIASSLNHLPEWLKAQFITQPPHRQISAYDSWAHDTIHGSCCPKAWMHRDCLAGYAASAALHYLKCPYCADKQTFIRSVISAGIWVPDRDAAWELEPGAYADLVPAENGNESDLTDQSSSSNTSTGFSQSSTIVSKSKESTAIAQSAREPTRSGRCSVRGQQLASLRDGREPETADRTSKAILSLVWSNRHLELRGRGGTLLRSRSRRLTPPTIQKSPPETVHRRRYSSRRRSSLFSRNVTLETQTSNHFSESHRLRQATLGSFLANLRVSSPT